MKMMNLEEAKKLGREILEKVCDDVFKLTGERPHIEDRGERMVIVWPDGEETNELEICIIN
jgi:hypothetical protein